MVSIKALRSAAYKLCDLAFCRGSFSSPVHWKQLFEHPWNARGNDGSLADSPAILALETSGPGRMTADIFFPQAGFGGEDGEMAQWSRVLLLQGT